ncbi:hypothetical protein GCM10008018_60460 [Paenibacillus marchantiophytorum]|uniref:Uncharacterized protein n=1 Tax=Paenibacillus marchantiophytorum TaxID=1619310 RepID=A0ABQ1FD09_9BACL|nr:hypothetical protein [Paenibacillus marchantiophytorum]GGA06502.1 hypothetical protein GCM10008018_60460 [Paenibacillus marchantiophytorum]
MRTITVRMKHRDNVADEMLIFDWNAYLLTDNVALILEPEDETATISRVKLRDDGTYARTFSRGFEIPIDLKTFIRIQSAPTELHALIAALAI